MIDLIILIIYTAVEGARGSLTAMKVINRENPEDVFGVSGLVHVHVRAVGYVPRCFPCFLKVDLIKLSMTDLKSKGKSQGTRQYVYIGDYSLRNLNLRQHTQSHTNLTNLILLMQDKHVARST